MKEATGGRGADVVLDMVGGDYTARNLDVLAIEGRLVQIAFLKSPQVTLDLSLVMRRAPVGHRVDVASADVGREGRDCPHARGRGMAAACRADG